MSIYFIGSKVLHTSSHLLIVRFSHLPLKFFLRIENLPFLYYHAFPKKIPKNEMHIPKNENCFPKSDFWEILFIGYEREKH